MNRSMHRMDSCGRDSCTREWSTLELCEHGYFPNDDDCSKECLLAWRAGNFCAHRFGLANYNCDEEFCDEEFCDEEFCDEELCSSNRRMDDVCHHGVFQDSDGCEDGCLR